MKKKPDQKEEKSLKLRSSANAHEALENSYKLQIYVGYDKLIEGDFHYTTVSNPTNVTDRGFYLDNCHGFDNSSAVFQEIMVKDGDKYFLPYRVLSEFSFTNPWFSNKYLSTVFKRTNDNTFNIYIYFPYKAIGWVINAANCIKIKNWANAARLAQQSQITSVKGLANDAASKYIVNLNLFTELSKNAKALDSQIALINKNISRINDTIDDEQKRLKIATDKVSSLEIQIANEKVDQNNIKTKITQLGNQINIMQESVEDLEKNKKNATDPNIYKKKFENNREEYMEQSNILSREAPQAEYLVKKAKVALFEDNNLESNQDNLREITP